MSHNNFILSQRFDPEAGGSITWIREVYSRWPTPCTLLTHDYSLDESASELGSSNLKLNQRSELREETQGSLNILRSDLLLDNWGLDSLPRLKKYWRMYKFARSAPEGSVFHCNHLVPEGLACAAAIKLNPRKKKIVSYVHGEELLAYQSSRQLSLLAHSATKASDLIITNSQAVKEMLAEFSEEATEKTKVIHPGVDFALFNQARDARDKARQDLGIEKDEVLFVTLGRLCARKNQTNSIKALKNSKYKYLILGEGKEKQGLVELSQSLGMKDRVIFRSADTTKEAAELLAASDVFIMPSIQTKGDLEGFGIVFIEAAAAGLPSISGIVGGQVEAVINGETGFNVDGNSVEEISEKAFLLASAQELRERMSESAISWAKANDWNKVLKKTLSAVSSI